MDTRQKIYLGKTLPPIFQQDQIIQVPNPAKHDTDIYIDKSDLNDVVHLIRQCNNLRQLAALLAEVERAFDRAVANDDLPDTVAQRNWPGRIACERIRCGKPGCKCKGKGHGPYYYWYPQSRNSQQLRALPEPKANQKQLAAILGRRRRAPRRSRAT